MDHFAQPPHFCQGPCRNGTHECPCPWACETPEPDELRETLAVAVKFVLFACGVVVISLLVMVAL